MSIRQIQLNRVIENIVKYYLEHGKYPGFQTVTHHLSGWLRKHSLGAPSFKYSPVRKREESSSKLFNEHIGSIYQDLQDSYDATINHINRTMRDFEYMETERKKIRHELSLLEKDIQKLLMIETSSDYRHFDGEVISFESADQVDQTKSTIMLDLEKQSVSLKESLKETSRIPIDASRVVFEPLMPNSKTAALESVKRAFDQNSNTSWWQIIKTKTPGSIDGENSMGMRAQLTVPFDRPRLLNEIRYNPHHMSPTNIRVEVSTDNTGFHPIPTEKGFRRVTSTETWEFPPVVATAVKFVFEKKEHEDRSAGQYQFYFGAKDISFFQKRYAEEGVLYTKPMSFKQEIKSLSIETNERVPVNTSIKYEVALYDENKEIQDLMWQTVAPLNNKMNTNRMVEFNNKKMRTANLTFAEPVGKVENGMHLFRLQRENGDPIVSELFKGTTIGEREETFDLIKEAELHRGLGQWKREQAYLPFKGEIPLNDTWRVLQERKAIETDYIQISNTLKLKDNYGLERNNLYRFTTCIYTEDAESAPFSLSMIKTIGNGLRKRVGTYAIYVNHKRQRVINDEISLELEIGWNEIVISMHFGDMHKRADLPQNELPKETYIGKFHMSKYPRIRAELRPMSFIDYHDLFYNVSPNNRDYFTIFERQVVLNYMPVNCNFQIRYEAIRDNEPAAKGVILRATLKRDKENISVTPEISSINVRVG